MWNWAVTFTFYIVYFQCSPQIPLSNLSWHLGEDHNLIPRICLRAPDGKRGRDKNLKGEEQVLGMLRGAMVL